MIRPPRTILILACLLIVPTTSVAADIGGRLSTSDGTPIAGAVIRVYHNGGKFAGRTTTDAKGAYSMKLRDGKKIDWIQYDLTGFQPGTVKHLAGDQTQSIYKVLLSQGELATIPEQVNQWAAYEQIFWILRTSPRTSPESEKKKKEEDDLYGRRLDYLEMMQDLRSMSNDKLVSVNADRIIELYQNEL